MSKSSSAPWRASGRASIAHRLRAGCAGVILAIPVTAAAQEAPPAAPQAGAVAEQQQASSAEPSNDIVVTAQRRAERLEDVPMSIAVVSGEAVERAGLGSLRDIGQITSGVQVNMSGAFTQPAIRGVTSLTNGNGNENNVAIYVDGFYEPNSVTIAMDLANLAGIEVLKGPQGTLYGRNATGGAILLKTLDPSETLTGKADLSYARFDDRRASGYISGPLSDTLRFSVAGSFRKRDGYQKLVSPTTIGETVGDANPLLQRSIRTKLELDVTPDLTGTLAYNYAYSNDPSGQVYSPYEHVPAFLPNPPQRAPRLGLVSYNFAPSLKNTTHNPTLKLVLNTGFGTLSSYTGYSFRKDRSRFDFDGTYARVSSLRTAYDQDTFQQTVDASISAIDRLDLTVGANYFYDHVRNPSGSGAFNFGANDALTAVGRGSIRSESYAFYVDGTYALTPALSLNVGGRYTHDEKTIDFTSRTGAGVVTFPQTRKDATFSKFTPRASLRYEVAPRTNVYASVSRGFRSGQYNIGGAANPDLLVATQPETITAYELGFKTARQTIRFEAAAFYYDYKDLQVSVARPNPNCPAGTVCVPLPLFANAPKAEIYGIDARLDVTPVERLTFGLGAAWLHARYKVFPDATGLGLNAATNTNVTQVQDWAGQQMARAPDFTANASASYTAPLAGGELLLAANASYTDSYVISNPSLFGPLAGAELANRQRFRQGHYALLGANVTWTDPAGRFSLGVFGTNLTDKRYRLTYNGSALGDYSALAMPRQIGARVGYRF